MRDRWQQFVWTWRFWALFGIVGCASGLLFQRLASNGVELWCLGLCFFAAAYVEWRGFP